MQIFLIYEILLTYYSIFFYCIIVLIKNLKLKKKIYSGLFFFHTYCYSYGIQDNEESVPEIKNLHFNRIWLSLHVQVLLIRIRHKNKHSHKGGNGSMRPTLKKMFVWNCCLEVSRSSREGGNFFGKTNKNLHIKFYQQGIIQ